MRDPLDYLQAALMPGVTVRAAASSSPHSRGYPSPLSITRNCPRCETELPIDAFALDQSKARGRKSHCKACDRLKSRRYYTANREAKLAKANARNARRRAEVGR